MFTVKPSLTHTAPVSATQPHGPAEGSQGQCPQIRGQHSQGSWTGQGQPTGSSNGTPEHLLVPKEPARGGAGLNEARCGYSRGLGRRPPERAPAESLEHLDTQLKQCTLSLVPLAQLSPEAAGTPCGGYVWVGEKAEPWPDARAPGLTRGPAPCPPRPGTGLRQEARELRVTPGRQAMGSCSLEPGTEFQLPHYVTWGRDYILGASGPSFCRPPAGAAACLPWLLGGSEVIRLQGDT